MLLSDSGHAALLWGNCYVQISKLQIYNATEDNTVCLRHYKDLVI